MYSVGDIISALLLSGYTKFRDKASKRDMILRTQVVVKPEVSLPGLIRIPHQRVATPRVLPYENFFFLQPASLRRVATIIP